MDGYIDDDRWIGIKMKDDRYDRQTDRQGLIRRPHFSPLHYQLALDASSTPPPAVTTKMSPDIARCPLLVHRMTPGENHCLRRSQAF